MTAQAPLPLTVPDAVPVGPAASLVEDCDGGQVFLRGELSFAWDAGDAAGRRLAAVQLVRTGAATIVAVAAAFEADQVTVWRWVRRFDSHGVAGLVPGKRGPKGPSKLTGQVVARIRALRGAGGTLAEVARDAGVSASSVRAAVAGAAVPDVYDGSRDDAAADAPLPLLAEPEPRRSERGMARAGTLDHARPVFTPAARVPFAGLFLAFPALHATGLLECARRVFGALPAGFYGLDAVLTEATVRALAGLPRAEGAARLDPVSLGRVLGLDRAPEVKTIRRKLHQLADTGRAPDLIAAMAARHLNPPDAGGSDCGDGEGDPPAAVLYVDGHARAYHGARRIGSTHLSRLRFPAPATVETWVADAAGDPVMVVMSEPAASLAGELRRLLPELRAAVGDGRRVTVGFDRGGWSPALFQAMHEAGFDTLTWRKGRTPPVPADAFAPCTFTDDAGRTHAWLLADRPVDVPVDGAGNTFRMRQVSRLDEDGRQAHILTTRTDLAPAEVSWRMSARWRIENTFRYARTHLALDCHDSYTSEPCDPDRTVPNPARKKAYQAVTAARARYDRAAADTDAALLALTEPQPGRSVVVVANTDHNTAVAPLLAAEADLAVAERAWHDAPARLPLHDVDPGRQVLDTQVKLLTHAVRAAAFNATSALARDIRLHTDYARADQEAHTLIRDLLAHTGDIRPDTTARTLTIRLDPMPTRRQTTAAAQLCERLTATETIYPDTDLLLRYETKPHR